MALLSLLSILLLLTDSSVSMPLTGPPLELKVDPPAGIPSDTFEIRITNNGTEGFPYINCCSLPRITSLADGKELFCPVCPPGICPPDTAILPPGESLVFHWKPLEGCGPAPLLPGLYEVRWAKFPDTVVTRLELLPDPETRLEMTAEPTEVRYGDTLFLTVANHLQGPVGHNLSYNPPVVLDPAGRPALCCKDCAPTQELAPNAVEGLIQPESGSMPADYRLRPHDDERGGPPGPEPGKPDPEEAIAVTNRGSLHRSPKDRKLLAEREVLHRQGCTRPEQGPQDREDEREEVHPEISIRRRGPRIVPRSSQPSHRRKPLRGKVDGIFREGQVAATRFAAESAAPLIARRVIPFIAPPGAPLSKGPAAAAGISVSPDHVVLEAFKSAKPPGDGARGEGSEITLRIREIAGRQAAARLRLPGRILDARRVRLDEEPLESPVEFENDEIRCDLGPREVRTFRARIAGAPIPSARPIDGKTP